MPTPPAPSQFAPLPAPGALPLPSALSLPSAKPVSVRNAPQPQAAVVVNTTGLSTGSPATRQALAATPFRFIIRSLETAGTPISPLEFIAPYIEKMSLSVQSNIEEISYPFARQKYGQATEAPDISYSFDTLYLDRRFSSGQTVSGGTPQQVADKLLILTRVDPLLRRVPRLQVIFGATMLGRPNENFVHLTSFKFQHELYGVDGTVTSATVSLEFKQFGINSN